MSQKSPREENYSRTPPDLTGALRQSGSRTVLETATNLAWREEVLVLLYTSEEVS